MGQTHGAFVYITAPDTTPDFRQQGTFDPLYGFPNGRKEKGLS